MKTYRLSIISYNVTTSVDVDLSPSEVGLIEDIHASLIKQKAQNIIDIRKIDNENQNQNQKTKAEQNN